MTDTNNGSLVVLLHIYPLLSIVLYGFFPYEASQPSRNRPLSSPLASHDTSTPVTRPPFPIKNTPLEIHHLQTSPPLLAPLSRHHHPSNHSRGRGRIDLVARKLSAIGVSGEIDNVVFAGKVAPSHDLALDNKRSGRVGGNGPFVAIYEEIGAFVKGSGE